MEHPYLDHHHAVQFYGSDANLCSTVAGFLAQGFVDRYPAILIATPAHTAAVLEELEDRLIDVERARQIGDLVMLDAHKTLDLFMDGDTPDPQRFDESVGGMIGKILLARPERTLIRAYGEMVDVLWKAGNPEGAIKLEMLWNKLADQYGFALLCGYSMGNFLKQTALFEEVCRQHTHIMPAEVPKERMVQSKVRDQLSDSGRAVLAAGSAPDGNHPVDKPRRNRFLRWTY